MKLLDIISENEAKDKKAKLIYKALKKGKTSHQVFMDNLSMRTYEFNYELSDEFRIASNHQGKSIIYPKYIKVDTMKIRGQQNDLLHDLKENFAKFGIYLDISDFNRIIFTSDGNK